MIRFVFLVVPYFVVAFSSAYAQEAASIEQKAVRDKQRVIYLYNFTKYVEWKDMDKMTRFNIGVLGANEDSLVKQIENYAIEKKIKDLPVYVKYFKSIDAITDVQILYVHRKYNFEIDQIGNKISSYNTLLVGEEYPFHLCMINFIDIDGEFNFELNQEKINKAGLLVAPALVSFSIKSTADWEAVFNKTEKSLEAEKQIVKAQLGEIKEQENQITEQQENIKLQQGKLGFQKREIENQQLEMATQTEEFTTQKKKLGLLVTEVSVQQKSINDQVQVLTDQTREIETRKSEVAKQNKVLDTQMKEMEKQEGKITEQTEVLNKQISRIETQQLMIYVFIAFAILLSLMGFFIYRGYRNKQIANVKLEEQNEAITNQKVEIERQKDELEKRTTKLVQAAKMASLGQVAANLAHEVNTPLGAIKTSAEANKELTHAFWDELTLAIKDSTPEALNAVKELFKAQQGEPEFTSTKEDREFRTHLHPILEKAGLEHARNTADRLVQAGIHDVDVNMKIILQQPNREALIYVLTGLLNQRMHTANILLAVDKAARVVSSFKSYARTGEENKLVAVDIEKSINTVLVIYQNQLKRGIEVKKDFKGSNIINGYRDKINLVWTNIIHNAIQAMDHQGVLAISTSHDNGHLMVKIEDNGTGIPEDIQDQVFVPFFTTKKTGEGTGLGLDIVKTIIEDHKGKIWFESTPGKGTTFFISFPINKQDNGRNN